MHMGENEENESYDSSNDLAPTYEAVMENPAELPTYQEALEIEKRQRSLKQ